jgi:acetoin:2,6-dichlorophenolindophenol oxidoreductase subunit alpha
MSTRQMMQMYRTMHLIRAFEEAAGKAFQDGRIRGPVHQYVGQEAIAVGVCANLRATDYLASYHRGHGHAIAKGADIVKMMKELLGREGGTCGGKGGSMHIADFSVGMLGANGVVADGVTIAVGAAQAVKLLRQDRIVVPFFGDGAANRGPLLEAFNWAMIYKLPVLFVCEDNQYAATVKSAELTAGEGIVARARSFGIPAESVDGNDVNAVHDLAVKLVGRVRRGEGPALMHAVSYRWYGHFAHDSGLYRDQEAHRKALAGDPLERGRTWLLMQSIGKDDLDRIRRECEMLVDKALKEAEAAPPPWPQEAFTEVQDLGAEPWPR